MPGKMYDDAILKFNGGRGALLCNTCRVIIATGFDHEDKKHYCSLKCEKLDNEQSG